MKHSGRQFWNKHAGNYDRSMWLLGRPLPRMCQLAAEAVHGAPRVLEVAAGTGLVTPSLAQSAQSVVATDYADAMVAALQRRVRSEGLANVQCRQADIHALPFDDGEFDAIVAANVLHLVEDVAGALAALARVAKPQARLVLPTFCHAETVGARFVSGLLGVAGFPAKRRFTLQTLVQAVESAGIAVAHNESLAGVIPIGYVEGVFES